MKFALLSVIFILSFSKFSYAEEKTFEKIGKKIDETAQKVDKELRDTASMIKNADCKKAKIRWNSFERNYCAATNTLKGK